MADQTVRTIYEAVVSKAQRNLVDLGRDTSKAADQVDKLDAALDKAGSRDVKPKIDLDVSAAEAEVKKLTGELEKLEANPSDPKIDLDIAKSQAKIEQLQTELQILARMDASPQVEADTAKAEAQIEGLQNRIKAMESLNAETTLTVDIEQARKNLDRAESDLKALQGQKAELVVTADTDGVEADLDEMGDAAEDAGDDAGKAAGKALMDGLSNTPIVGAVTGLVAAVGIGVGAGLTLGFKSLAMGDMFGAQTGLDEATSRKFGAAAGAAYSNAWGESVESNLATARSAMENALILPDSTGREIQAVTEQLTAVSDILDVDVTEAAEAAGNMIKNGLAANAEEAFDVIVNGSQEGLNRSEDWLDTLREYSGMFESIGLSGAEAGGLIEQAMDAGARNSDVAADALKEFSIRAQDDSKTTNAAFETLGLNADKMGQAIAKGGDTAKDGLDQVLDGLRDIEDPMERNRVGVELFGTMWEDMGNGAGILAMDLDGLEDSWVNVGDTATDAMDRMQDNAATTWEKVKRDFTTAATTVLGGLASSIEEPLQQAGDWVNTHSADIMGFIIELGGAFFEVARAAVEFAATTIEVMGNVAGALDEIVGNVGFAIEAFGLLSGDMQMAEMGQRIQDAADDMTEFSENADGAADVLRTEVGGAIDSAEESFNNFTGPALMQAQIDDAITAMIGRLDEFSAMVDETGGTVKINGDTLEAEEALNSVIAAIDESPGGNVIINGETYPATEAYAALVETIRNDPGAEIKVSADMTPAAADIAALMSVVGDAVAEVQIESDTAPAEEGVEAFKGGAAEGEVYVEVKADTVYAEDQARAFQQTVNELDGTVTINGETMNAQQTFDTLMNEINTGEGYVNINGTTVDAGTALVQLTSMIDSSEGTVTIDGNAVPAYFKTDQAKAKADGTTGTIDVDANTAGAESGINHTARGRDTNIDAHASTGGAEGELNNTSRDRSTTVTASANTSVANAAINSMTYTRTAYINVIARSVGNAVRVASGQADGGRISRGLAGGGMVGAGYGMVPAPYPGPGVDNVLWPMRGAATGRMLDQPLAGGEWVVNPVSSAMHDSTLAAINNGATRAELAASFGPGGATTVDSSGIPAAVREGMRGMTVALNLDGRTLYGAVVDAGKSQRTPFVTRRG